MSVTWLVLHNAIDQQSLPQIHLDYDTTSIYQINFMYWHDRCRVRLVWSNLHRSHIHSLAQGPGSSSSPVLRFTLNLFPTELPLSTLYTLHITFTPDLYLNGILHCAATWLTDYIIARITRGRGVPMKVTSVCINISNLRCVWKIRKLHPIILTFSFINSSFFSSL